MPCRVSSLVACPCNDIISKLVSLIDYAIANKLTPFISMQNHYNLLYREEEREMFPTLKVVALDFLSYGNADGQCPD